MASGGGAILACFIISLNIVAAKYLKRSPTFTDQPFRGPLLSFVQIFFYYFDLLPLFLKSMIVWIVVLLGIFFCVLYCAARIYVVLESFISLRHVPIGVYQTPSGNFIDYIPHL